MYTYPGFPSENFMKDSLDDNIPPMVTCPSDITRPVPEGVTFLAVTFPNAVATDNSGIVSLDGVEPPSGSSFPVGTTNVTFSYSDPRGNIGTCTFTVTVYVGE